MLRRICLTRRVVGKLIHMAAIDPDIDPDFGKACFIEHFIKYACANEVAVGESCAVDKKEEELLCTFI